MKIKTKVEITTGFKVRNRILRIISRNGQYKGHEIKKVELKENNNNNDDYTIVIETELNK